MMADDLATYVKNVYRHFGSCPLSVAVYRYKVQNEYDFIGYYRLYMYCLSFICASAGLFCSCLEFNVPFQHKYGYIRDETGLLKIA